jgi:cell division protein FtsW
MSGISREKNWQKVQPDFYLLFAVVSLVGLGVVMVFSASLATAYHLHQDSLFFFKRHLLSVFLGLMLLIIGLKIDYYKYKKWTGLILLGTIFLLILVYVPGLGLKVGGSSRWLKLGFFSFQPSELAKLVFILVIAQIISNKKEKIKDGRGGFIPLLAWLFLMVGLVVRQPDFGTALIFTVVFFILIFLGGARLSHILGTLFFLAVAGGGIISRYAYQQRRLLAFLNPWKDPLGSGFHIIQSLLAVGSGGFWGLGLGSGRQKLAYLPLQFTDFIYAIICEELGFVGAVGVILVFVFVAVRGFRIARNAPDSFGMLLAAGITSWLLIQAAINLAVVVGVLPVTGIPLSLISFGGTALLVSLFGVGILLNISCYRRPT